MLRDIEPTSCQHCVPEILFIHIESTSCLHRLYLIILFTSWTCRLISNQHRVDIAYLLLFCLHWSLTLISQCCTISNQHRISCWRRLPLIILLTSFTSQSCTLSNQHLSTPFTMYLKFSCLSPWYYSVIILLKFRTHITSTQVYNFYVIFSVIQFVVQ